MSDEKYLELISQPGFWLGKEQDDADTRYRLGLFQTWLEQNKITWLGANLADFRDELLEQGYASSSVSAIMGTLRERIRSFTSNNQFNDWVISVGLVKEGWSFPEAEAHLQHLLRRISNIADARNSSVSMPVRQDETDEQRLWINGEEKEFLYLMGQDKPELLALRDQAMVALFLATGIRREELTNLVGDDLVQRYRNHPALLVRHGKGDKQRMVLYGSLWEEYIQPYVLPWLDIVGSYTEPFFQGFWKGFKTLRERKLHVSTVNDIIGSVPLEIDGRFFKISPHDLRRTYARAMFQNYGLPIEGIQEQMGHNDIKITRHYIGQLDLDFRLPNRKG